MLRVEENLKQSLSAFFVVVWSLKKNSFCICYLAAPQQTLGYFFGLTRGEPVTQCKPLCFDVDL